MKPRMVSDLAIAISIPKICDEELHDDSWDKREQTWHPRQQMQH